MKLHKCPECRHKLTTQDRFCSQCGFSLQEPDLALYREKHLQRYLDNQKINQQSIKIHLFWLIIFIITLLISAWFIK